MGILVYSLLRVMQDVYHQKYFPGYIHRTHASAAWLRRAADAATWHSTSARLQNGAGLFVGFLYSSQFL